MEIRFNAAPFSVARSWISFAASTVPTYCNLIFQILNQVTSLSHALASFLLSNLSCSLQLAAYCLAEAYSTKQGELDCLSS
jgi:hypothetical protein